MPQHFSHPGILRMYISPAYTLYNSCDFFDSPSYLPPQWSAYSHPEARLYFCRQSAPRIITEAHLYNPDIMAKVTIFVKKIDKLLVRKGIALSSNVELFLQIDGAGCGYYFVDHATRTEFWLDPLDADDLNIPPVVSPSHLSSLPAAQLLTSDTDL